MRGNGAGPSRPPRNNNSNYVTNSNQNADNIKGKKPKRYKKRRTARSRVRYPQLPLNVLANIARMTNLHTAIKLGQTSKAMRDIVIVPEVRRRRLIENMWLALRRTLDDAIYDHYFAAYPDNVRVNRLPSSLRFQASIPLSGANRKAGLMFRVVYTPNDIIVEFKYPGSDWDHFMDIWVLEDDDIHNVGISTTHMLNGNVNRRQIPLDVEVALKYLLELVEKWALRRDWYID